jgi:hypothetical protein
MSISAPVQRESTAAGYVATAREVSLHTDDPGDTGANEVVGGDPAYARQPIIWNAGEEDGVFVSDPIEINVPAVDVTHFAVWNDDGTFRDAAPGGATFLEQGVYRLTLRYTQL